MTGRAILTAVGMRAAEERVIAAGTPVQLLMERAGTGAAEAIWRHFGPMDVLVLCGPGNNGGDGYVIARELRARGARTRVAAAGDPRSEAARAARESWDGEVEPLEAATSASLLVDALFGTGLSRPVDDMIVRHLRRLAEAARFAVAIDLPSGAASDDGRLLSPVPDYALTISFQTLKPSHRLQPAAQYMGRIAIVDIGIDAHSRLIEVERPVLPPPGPDDHKYSRGYVGVMAGAMGGAAALVAAAAVRAGAGYVRLFADSVLTGIPLAIVQSPDSPFQADPRIGALVVGPGLGAGPAGEERLDRALAASVPLVLDADALTLLAARGGTRLPVPAILTPHAGEFARLFGDQGGSKVDQARSAAERTGACLLFKGPDTVIAAPDGRAALAPPAPHWLASAGTGDVLAGIVGVLLANMHDPFHAACAAAWLHGRAAELAGPGLAADDLLPVLGAALAECR